MASPRRSENGERPLSTRSPVSVPPASPRIAAAMRGSSTIDSRWDGTGRAPNSRTALSTASTAATSTSSSLGSRPTSMPPPILVSPSCSARALTDSQHDVPRPYAAMPALEATAPSPAESA